MKKQEQQVAQLARRIMFLVAIVATATLSQVPWTHYMWGAFLNTAGALAFATGALFWFFVIRTREGLYVYAIRELWILVALWATITVVGVTVIIFFTSMSTQKVTLLAGCLIPPMTLTTLWFFSIVHNIPICTIRMGD